MRHVTAHLVSFVLVLSTGCFNEVDTSRVIGQGRTVVLPAEGLKLILGLATYG